MGIRPFYFLLLLHNHFHVTPHFLPIYTFMTWYSKTKWGLDAYNHFLVLLYLSSHRNLNQLNCFLLILVQEFLTPGTLFLFWYIDLKFFIYILWKSPWPLYKYWFEFAFISKTECVYFYNSFLILWVPRNWYFLRKVTHPHHLRWLHLELYPCEKFLVTAVYNLLVHCVLRLVWKIYFVFYTWLNLVTLIVVLWNWS